MSGVFQNIYPHPSHRPSNVYPPPPARLCCGGRTHSLGGEGVGGQQFGRRQTLLCTLYMQVLCDLTHNRPLYLQVCMGERNQNEKRITRFFVVIKYGSTPPPPHVIWQSKSGFSLSSLLLSLFSLCRSIRTRLYTYSTTVYTWPQRKNKKRTACFLIVGWNWLNYPPPPPPSQLI